MTTCALTSCRVIGQQQSSPKNSKLCQMYHKLQPCIFKPFVEELAYELLVGCDGTCTQTVIYGPFSQPNQLYFKDFVKY